MIAETAYGKIRGVKQDGCIIYKGIPYAKPPVGELRWRPPQKPDAWDGVLNADSFPNRCVQREREPGSFFYKELEGGEGCETPLSEDCLYLNIWTPEKTGGGKLPVALWIHGGAFLGGYGHEKEFDGAAYAAKGVILVTINYRLGVWGFLAHPWLSAESGKGVSGNYGILDQIAALRWVRENIGAFGGDKDNVTLFGQSAGAMSVLALISSELTKGLFSKAILQSGIGLECNIPLSRAEAGGTELSDFLGAGSAGELRAMPVETIARGADYLAMKGFRPGGELLYAPNIDGWLLKDEYTALQKSGAIHDIPYIAGTTRLDIMAEPEAVGRGDRGPMYTATLDFAQRVNAVNKNKVFLYYFTHALPGDDAGAFHSSELWYTFGSLGRCWRPMQEEDYALARRMTGCWTDFMISGDPGWPAYACDNAHVEVFDV